VFAFLWVPIPSALFASLALAAVVVKRALSEGIAVPQFFRTMPQYFPR
jgi:hypothetical protein